MVGSTAGTGDGGGAPERELEAIVLEHETALLRYATRLTNDADAAQDVVQNVFVKLFREWKPGLKPSKRLKGWLFRVTHNEAVDHIRRESRLRALHERHAAERNGEETVCADGAHCSLTHEEKMALVLRQVRALAPREQQVLLLRLEEGLSYREIAEVTGRTVGNVGKVLNEAVGKLAGLVKKHLSE